MNLVGRLLDRQNIYIIFMGSEALVPAHRSVSGRYVLSTDVPIIRTSVLTAYASQFLGPEIAS
jgi:hypothetical protein